MTNDFVHRWVPGAADKTVLLLHGTGGDENDLLGLGRMIAPDASFLSPRGKVLERGMPRFFRRLSEGVFDLDDLRLRTHELADWISDAALEYGFDRAGLVALGYSNGANIAASMLLLRPESIANAGLLRAMLPFEPDALPDLSKKRILMSNGKHDPIIPMASSARLAEIFRASGAEVTFNAGNGGHGLEQNDIDQAHAWYQTLPATANSRK
jgi:phospholipase/carboxylesterase